MVAEWEGSVGQTRRVRRVKAENLPSLVTSQRLQRLSAK